MLINDIDESIALGKKYLNATSAKKYLSEITYQEPIISQQVELCKKVISSSKALSNVGTVDSYGIQRITRGFDSIKDDLNEMDSKTLDKDVQALQEDINRELSSLKTIWNNYRFEHMKTNETLIDALQNVIADEADMEELSQLQQQINQIDIGDEQAIKRVELFSKKSKQIIQALEMGAEVEQFLIALSEDDGITLDMVTPEIHSWLAKHNLLKKMYISI